MEMIIEMMENDPAFLEAAALGIVTVATLITVAGICAVIRYLMRAIGYSKMYRKAGVAGWKAFVPVYNIYNNYKISWDGKMFFLSAALFIVSSVLDMYTEGAMALVGMAVSVGLIVMVVKQNMKMAKLFGKGSTDGSRTYPFGQEPFPHSRSMCAIVHQYAIHLLCYSYDKTNALPDSR